jgi:hypothetical protein
VCVAGNMDLSHVMADELARVATELPRLAKRSAVLGPADGIAQRMASEW